MNLYSKPALLDSIADPADLRALPAEALKDLADELRRETINVVSVTGGHLGAGLGVVELTVALHRVFDTPRDKLIWDVGHQSYPHKILTGRRAQMRTLRQGGQLPVSPSAPKVPMTRSVLRMLPHRFPRAWALRWRVICRARSIMWFA